MLSKKTYYTLSYTWGIIITLIGLLIGKTLQIMGYKPEPNLYGVRYTIGKNWGGVSFGPVAIVSQSAKEHTWNHEFGHSIQNCFFGPFMIFIALASVIRYWYRRGFDISDPPYDSIWFEGQATEWGEYYKSKI